MGAQGAAPCQLWVLCPHPSSCQRGVALQGCVCGERMRFEAVPGKPLTPPRGLWVCVCVSQWWMPIECSPESPRLWFVAEVTVPTAVHSWAGGAAPCQSSDTTWGKGCRSSLPAGLEVCLFMKASKFLFPCSLGFGFTS